MSIVASLFILLYILLAIGLFAFWIYTLLDCINKEPTDGNDRLIWILVIVLLNGLGALLYFFVRRKERIRLYGR